MRALDSWFRPKARPPSEAVVVAMLVAGSVALLVALAALARTYTIDGYIYLAKARSIASGHGVSVPWNGGVDRKFFWGYSFALAGPVAAFGERGFVALAALVHAALGWTFFRFLRTIEAVPSVRVVAVALLAFNPLLLWWSSVPASEPLFTLLALEAIRRGVLFRKSRGARWADVILAAVFAGLATATRAEGIVLLPVLVAMVGRTLWIRRRFDLVVACIVVGAAPESAHLHYLHAHALAAHATSEYLDEWRSHFRDIEWKLVAWENVRAPFWTIFRFDTDAPEYRAHFPASLVAAQTVVAHAYLAALALGLVCLVRRQRRAVFLFACGIGIYAAIHALWYYRYERFMTVTTPFAAYVFASAIRDGIGLIGRSVRPIRILILPAGAAFAAISAVYAVHVVELHSERLTSRDGQRDYRAIAARVNAVDRVRRPIVTDLGPYLAYYTRDRRSFLVGQSDFYDDAVPACSDGRDFLVAHGVGVIVWKDSIASVAERFDLGPADYDLTFGAPTVLSLHVRATSEGVAEAKLARDYVTPPRFGGKIAVDRVVVTTRRTSRCGEVRVTVSGHAIAHLAAGDELFVHANDAAHFDRRLDVCHGAVASKEGGHFDQVFMIHIPNEPALRNVEVWIGMWNTYDGQRAHLDAAQGERADADRLLVDEPSVALH